MDNIIRLYNDKNDRESVIRILESSFIIVSPHNNPADSIDRKVKQMDDLFFVAETVKGEVIGTVMVGYDGHRGWIYSLSVDPKHRGKGIGTSLLRFAEEKLSSLGCPKVNLQVLMSNSQVISFYKKNGYNIEENISMSKKLY